MWASREMPARVRRIFILQFSGLARKSIGGRANRSIPFHILAVMFADGEIVQMPETEAEIDTEQRPSRRSDSQGEP